MTEYPDDDDLLGAEALRKRLSENMEQLVGVRELQEGNRRLQVIQEWRDNR